MRLEEIWRERALAESRAAAELAEARWLHALAWHKPTGDRELDRSLLTKKKRSKKH